MHGVACHYTGTVVIAGPIVQPGAGSSIGRTGIPASHRLKIGREVRSGTTVTEAEVAAALAALGDGSIRVPVRAWPGALGGLDHPGLYAWWVDSSGAGMLSAGFDAEVATGRIYAGQAGATAWPSGTKRLATLRSRIGGNHIRGSVRGSTFRLTLAAVLRAPLKFEVIGPRKLEAGSERRLTEWILAHLEVAVHPFPDADRLGQLERGVLSSLDPPRNSPSALGVLQA